MQIKVQNHPGRVVKLKKLQKPVLRDFTYTQVINDEDLSRKTLDILKNEDYALPMVVPEMIPGRRLVFVTTLGLLITVFLTFHMKKINFRGLNIFFSDMVATAQNPPSEVNEVFFGPHFIVTLENFIDPFLRKVAKDPFLRSDTIKTIPCKFDKIMTFRKFKNLSKTAKKKGEKEYLSQKINCLPTLTH